MIQAIRNSIPNTLTSFNLFCGFLGIYFAFNEALHLSAYCIGFAAIFDFLDGFAARLLKAQSNIGKELDSLADMVTFGVLPGVILFQLTRARMGLYFEPFEQYTFTQWVLTSIPVLVTIFSALRLANFNVDTRQTENFIGLATPASAILIASFPLILEVQFEINYLAPLSTHELLSNYPAYKYSGVFQNWGIHALLSPTFYQVVGVGIAALLVAPVGLFSFKFKSLGWTQNQARFLFLIAIVVLLVFTFFPYWGLLKNTKNYPYLDYLVIPLIILLYLIIGATESLIKQLKKDA